MSGAGPSASAPSPAVLLAALRAELERRTRAAREPIAIVGLGCRFPGASGPRAFFDFLLEGGDAVREVPADRWDADALFDPDPLAPGRAYSRWGAFVDEPLRFDASFFGISAREAAAMDPQQRVLLEVTWEALEDAGLARRDLAGTRGGVYMGICHSDHAHAQSRNLEALDAYSTAGGAFSIAANRISYLFDLHGPSLAVDTACSSSLTAAHLACHALRSGETDLAIAGGVSLMLSPVITVNFCKIGALSRDGRSKFLDARADGYVRGEGAGVVILKTLSRAQRDGDRIYACILGSAMTQDGRSSGLTAPNGPAQEDVIRAACAQAGVAPHELDYVEAHGTGTPLGDVAEAHALGATVGRGRSGAPCLVGSVKANIGHLEAAAGVAGLLKLSQMLHRGSIPRQLNFEQPHPEIPLAQLGLDVARESRAWPRALGAVRAGLSSFGFGGANVHMVLGAPPLAERHPSAAARPRSELLILSAHHPRALDALVAEYRDGLDAAAPLSALCSAAARQRSEHRERLALVARDRAHLAELLAEVAAGSLPEGAARGRPPADALGGPVFVFPGQGSAWWKRCPELLAEPVFADVVRAADALLAGRFELSLREFLESDAAAQLFMTAPQLGQAALVAAQLGMAALLRAHGLRPAALIGHSVGEISAAACAGALTLGEALEIAYARGLWISRASAAGGTALVALAEREVRERLAQGSWPLEVAAVNGPSSVAISGPSEPLDAFVRELGSAGVYARRLEMPFAAHSSAMDPLLDGLRSSLPELAPRRGSAPIFSAIQPKLLDGSELGASYWLENLRRPVRFADAVERAYESGYGAFLEVGPACPLWRDAERAAGRDAVALPSVRKDLSVRDGLLRAAAALYVRGAEIDWRTLYPERPAGSLLPRYPWQHQTHRPRSEPPRARGPHPWLGPGQELADPGNRWIYPGAVSEQGDSAPVLAAAAFLALFEAVALDRGLAHPLRFERVSIEPLAVAGSDAAELQVSVDLLPAAALHIAVYGRAGEQGPWMRVASAEASAADPLAVDAPEPLASIVERCGSAQDRVALAESGRAAAIRSLHLREGEALAALALASRAARSWRADELDACLQLLTPAASASAERRLVPVAIEQAYLHAAPSARLWSHATVAPAPPGATQLCADVCVRDEDERLRAELLGITLSALDAEPRFARPTRGVCTIRWKAQPAAAVPATRPQRPQWVVLGPRSALVDALAAAAAARGEDACHPPDAAGLEAQLRAGAPAGTSRTVLVVLPDAGTEREESVGESVPRVAQGFLEALRTLAATPGRDLRVVLVSGAALRVGDDARAPDPTHAAVLALGRVAAIEHPWLSCTCVDVDPREDPADVARELLQTLAEGSSEPELALRGCERFVPRLHEDVVQPAQSGSSVRGDGTYLISGGLGGLGLEVARWLVERGARSLVLIGRSEPGEDARRRVEALRARGAEVRTERVDVSDRAALAALLERMRASAAPLRGIVHTAALLESAPLSGLDGAQLARALAAKVCGAAHLDALTRGADLDFFVLFSSLAALVGSPGLGAYSAANACLDALADARAARGLPVLNIRWGRWADVGLAARASATTRGALAMPEPAMSTEVGIAHLERLLQSGARSAIVVPEALLERASLPALLRANPLFADLPDQAGASAFERPPIDRKYVAPTDELEAQIAAIWSEVLRLERVGIRDEIFELGGDSIVGGQIVTRINRSFGTSLTLRKAFEAFTVEALASYLREESGVRARSEPARRSA